MTTTSPRSGWSFGEVGLEPCAKAPSENATREPASLPVSGGWRTRLEDPFTRYFRDPIARPLGRALARTGVSPQAIAFVGPLLAALGGYFITFGDAAHLMMAGLAFELRSLSGRIAAAVAHESRPQRPLDHEQGTIIDALSWFFLYAGIFWHCRLHAPPVGPWSQYLSVNGVLLVALSQGVVGAFAASHYRRQIAMIFEGEEHAPLTRLIGFLWRISNGSTFHSLIALSLVVNQLWAGQLFFASVGVLWILGVILLSAWFFRSASRRAKLAVA